MHFQQAFHFCGQSWEEKEKIRIRTEIGVICHGAGAKKNDIRFPLYNDG
jgi:hypothetical protein